MRRERRKTDGAPGLGFADFSSTLKVGRRKEDFLLLSPIALEPLRV